MSCVAASSGSAPVAKDHFKSFSPDSRVRTGGISFRKTVDVPARIQDIIDEFNEVKYIDSLNFECIQAEWSGPFLPYRWCAYRKRYSECLRSRCGVVPCGDLLTNMKNEAVACLFGICCHMSCTMFAHILCPSVKGLWLKCLG